MKRMIALLFLPICMFGLAACSDSVFGTDARYKLYPTQNMWTFLKLYTETGRIWQVQYSSPFPDAEHVQLYNAGPD